MVGDRTFINHFATILYAYYRQRTVSNMFYVQVVEYFRKNFPKPLSLSEIEGTVQKIMEWVPGWLTFVETATGRILRINNAIDIDCVKEQLAKAKGSTGLLL